MIRFVAYVKIQLSQTYVRLPVFFYAGLSIRK